MSDLRVIPDGSHVSALYRKYEGRPAIVVGGGPSTPAQLAKLPFVDNAVLVSANAHAFKLGLSPDFILCKDHRHSETNALMEPQMREYGVPIVSRNHWADYRLAAWPIQGNSGMMAVGLAVVLGCRPVVPVGFDCYQNGTYFHAPTARNVSGGRGGGHWKTRYERMAAKLVGAAVRAMPGALFGQFPTYWPGEVYDRFHMPTCLQRYESMKWEWARAKQAFVAKDTRAEVPAGYVFPVSEGEAAAYHRAGLIEKVDSRAAA